MATSDADRWNDRYSSASSPTALQPPEIVTAHLGMIGGGHRTLDVACGWGDAGLHLATQGAAATFTDVSSVALVAVAERAASLGVEVETVAADLETDPVPTGAWQSPASTISTEPYSPGWVLFLLRAAGWFARSRQ